MFWDILSYADIYMPFVTLIAFFIARKNIPKKDHSIVWFAFINVIVFLAGDIIARITGNNLFTYHLYYAYEMIFVAWYFCRNLFKKFTPLFYIISGVYVLFWITDVLNWESLTTFPSFSAVFEKTLVIFLCMYYLFQFANSERIMHFQRLPDFWITSAFLVASALEIFSVAFYKYFETIDKQSSINAWLIGVTGVVIKFIFLSIALLCYKRKQDSFPLSSSL